MFELEQQTPHDLKQDFRLFNNKTWGFHTRGDENPPVQNNQQTKTSNPTPLTYRNP